MLDKLLRFGAGAAKTPPSAANEDAPIEVREHLPCCDGRVHLANVHAFATGAALAVSVDTSPAALVSIYDYARHLPRRGRRCA